MNPCQAKLHLFLAGLVLVFVLASCGGLPNTGRASQVEAARPPCSDLNVLAQLVEIANAHPDYSPGFPSPAQSIGQVVETQAYDIPDVGAETFRRICIGEMTLGSGEVVAIGWEIFTTGTILGPLYGINPCFGKYDTVGRDCTALSEGRLPGEVTPTPQPAR